MAITIKGTGSCLPKKVLTNFDLEKMVDTSDAWIRERTGMSERHIAENETVASLATEAAKKALEDAGRSASDVDLIIVATCTGEVMVPCTACKVQADIGADNAVAFDINSACSGFLFALQTASAYIASGMHKNALVIGSEVLSSIINWEDRSTCVLFGDGAGAVFVEDCAEEGRGILSMVQGSSGSKGGVLYFRKKEADPDKEDEYEGKDAFVHMNGAEVYKFAVRQVPECIEKALSDAGITASDVDLFVLHQANIRIIEAISKRLGAGMEHFPVNIHKTGNTSSASIPLLLDELNKEGKIKDGDTMVLSGFGGGLTYGACVLKW